MLIKIYPDSSQQNISYFKKKKKKTVTNLKKKKKTVNFILPLKSSSNSNIVG